MTTLGRLLPRDLERLSAYVDGALPPREQAAIEARLKTVVGLQEALDELRYVKAAVGSLPQRRAPRNFTLREAQVSRRAARPAFPYLRFATVLATGLFVITTVARTIPLPIVMGASAPQFQQAAEVQGLLDAAIAGTAEVGEELSLEAPAAAAPPEGVPSEAMAPAPTTTAAGTACPGCPNSLPTAKSETGLAEDDAAGRAASVAPPLLLSPLLAAQWLLAMAAVVFGLLSVRARRGR